MEFILQQLQHKLSDVSGNDAGAVDRDIQPAECLRDIDSVSPRLIAGVYGGDFLVVQQLRHLVADVQGGIQCEYGDRFCFAFFRHGHSRSNQFAFQNHAAPGHLARRGNIEQIQYGWSDIRQSTTDTQRDISRACQQQRHRVAGMACMRLSTGRIDHLVAVAMVSGQQDTPAMF